MHNNIILKPRKSRENYGQHITMDELIRYKAKLLESTNDAYYLIYQNNKERNYFTSQWPLFFGFNPEKKDIWKDR